MTDVTTPNTIFAKALKINGGAGAPTSLEDGELYIDEVARKLYVKTASGLNATPLDVMGYPSTIGVDAEYVLVKSDTGSEWRELSAGGGGFEPDAEPWHIPGLAPASMGSLTFPAASGQTSLMRLGKAGLLVGTRVRATFGTGSLTMTIYEYDGSLGAQVYTHTYAIAGAGVYTFAPNFPFDAGEYAIVFTCLSSIIVEVVQGYTVWSDALQAHPVSLQVNYVNSE
ncbi:hypothetical protein CcrColossus_gp092 [Caulobacter phage CcrColossus]|uniref:Uncharacterized protein n=1 Tax=Caulobacter phage CcrColossus TaxID=1211640 RepID=K4K643_9CAUD|nr:hypothetical protein CcrColossus_gp092 [Caulobacter phage CcrColossus]AFU87962.1 hypothetical protein CcrColossus_gp092 [Caulobacter phage CcrColossus]